MNIIKKLPKELRRYILAFTHSPQPAVLTNDIRHYVFSRSLIQDWYTNRFAWEYPNAENDWLRNDLIGFYDKKHASMCCYRDYFYIIFSRMFSLKNKSREQLLSICNNTFKYCKKTNNVTWGLMTIEERCMFIDDLL